jgi:16S rRNA (guanine(966)-N(2))-methyltransferase RsmD
MRVISGKYRSQPLVSLRGMDVRPTSDRLRETLFDVLTAGNPEALVGSVWLDLYAGTGAVGIEALSRGASEVHFVESSRAAAETIRKNLARLGIAKGYEVLPKRVSQAIRSLERQGVVADVVFIDPPYCMQKAYTETLSGLAQSPLLSTRTMVIAEHEKKFDPGEKFAPLVRFRRLVQGSTALSLYRLRDVQP